MDEEGPHCGLDRYDKTDENNNDESTKYSLKGKARGSNKCLKDQYGLKKLMN